MTDTGIYGEIAVRTGGDIYIGVVGPVRSGKSTLIKRFTENLILPNIEGDYLRERAKDEMPQSASGRTVMTTEPKFIPENAVELPLDENARCRVKLIDCVGYIVPGAMGLIEDGKPRMVMTPWSETPLPFEQAAETGTRKVINEHSTVGIVVTTDGSIGEIPREAYEEAEERVGRAAVRRAHGLADRVEGAVHQGVAVDDGDGPSRLLGARGAVVLRGLGDGGVCRLAGAV